MLSEGRRVNLEVVAALVGQVEKGRRGEDGSAGTPHGAAEQRQQQQQQQPDAALAAEGAMPAAAGEPSSAALAELASALGELGVGGAGSAASGGAAAQAEAVVLAEARSQGVLEQAVGGLMKQVRRQGSGSGGGSAYTGGCGPTERMHGAAIRRVGSEQGCRPGMPPRLPAHHVLNRCAGCCHRERRQLLLGDLCQVGPLFVEGEGGGPCLVQLWYPCVYRIRAAALHATMTACMHHWV